MSATRIEWTEQTWNPVTGCTKVSPGCRHCYAERMALRLQAMNAPGYARGFDLILHEDRLGQPLERKKPTVYFVGSMADLFHEDVPDAFVDRMLAVIRQTPRHTYLLLTKRPENVNDMVPAYWRTGRHWPANLWIGTTVENQAAADKRIRIVGVNYKDQPDKALNFLKRYGNPFAAIGVDASGRAGIEWGVYGVPETFIVGRDGMIAYKLVGPVTPENIDSVLRREIEKALAKG